MPTPAVICDLDGTLASCHWRTHLVDLDQHQPTVELREVFLGGIDACDNYDALVCAACGEDWPCLASTHETADWATFFDGLSCDAPVPGVRALLESLKTDHVVVLTSGRPDDRRYQTEWWLTEHDVSYDELVMRRAGDHRGDAVIKRELYEEQIAPRYDVRLVIDDRQAVVEMWRELGLPVVQVVDPRLPPLRGERT